MVGLDVIFKILGALTFLALWFLCAAWWWLANPETEETKPEVEKENEFNPLDI